MPHRLPTGWLLVLAALALAAIAPRPAAAAALRGERLVHRFDFEEREQGNFEDLPMHWFVIGRPADTTNPHFQRYPLHRELTARPGHPPFAKVRFDQAHRTSGRHSLMLELDGGHAGAFLENGALPAVPGSDYTLTAAVRTTPLRHARAVLAAYFIDDRGQRIDGSVARSEAVNTAGRWQTVGVRLRGDFSRAAWIGIEVLLLQPEAGNEALGERHVAVQDVRGAAWFDDITLWQLPHVSLSTQTLTNVVRGPQRPRLTVNVRDFTGRALTAEVTLYDHARRPVARASQPVGDGAPTSWEWRPPLERFGWYLGDLRVREKDQPDQPLARALGAFLWLGPEQPMRAADARRFALDAEGVPEAQLELLPELLDGLDLNALVLSCWDRGTTPANLEERQSRLDEIIQRMLPRGRRIVMSLSPVPDELAVQLDLDRRSPLPVFAAPPAAWRAALSPALLRHGQHVEHWQLGSVTQPDAFYLPALPALLQAADAELQGLAPAPRLVVPWRLEQARRRDLPASLVYALDVPPSIQPPHLPAHLEEFAAAPPAAAWLYLREAPANHLGHEARLAGLAQRMIYGWQAGADALALATAWTVPLPERPSLAPDPLLGAFTTMAHRLAGRRVVGRMPLAEGVECLILDGPAGGALAAWNVSAPPAEANIDHYLGADPVAIDLWGNRTALPQVDGRHRLALSGTPVVIEGIDPALARFRESFRIEPAFIESTQTLHQRSVTIANPWPRTITGHMTLLEPAAWRLEPRRAHFSIAAGQTATLPLEISFPVSEVSGGKRIVARFDFTADQRYVVDLAAPVKVGLLDIEFDAQLAVQRDPKTGKAAAVIEQQITNVGQRAMSIHAFANVPGFPRRESVVSRLMPGQTIVRRFRFEDAEAALRAGPVRVGVREASGPAVLNKVLDVGNSHDESMTKFE